ncbi:sialidase family protein [Halomonas sp. MCCC 1A11062]|uniref:WD40/YVTN/BNR-like repeat-containing protein n=1 Tax=Halomonas sp. MCCC 1A11062 TaxID=2733485 RepID=UPI001F228D5F|nr:sialidase family protein [Halomonas sp. MCCC 1A11062]MCE8040068.1 exo-alpha-sialidase [Halomonas sp. MCCC 1A11062]
MSRELAAFERPQVKGVLAGATGIYLAAETGLYELHDRQLREVPAWRGRPVQQVAAAAEGYLVLLEDDSGQTLHLCDSQWQPRRELPRPAGEKIKCLHAQAEHLLVGTKRGLYRLPLADTAQASDWQCLFRDSAGWGEVLWASSQQAEHIRASVKKLGAAAKPALIETHDAGVSWHVESLGDYQDLILAADERRLITRWKGCRERYTTSGYKKHPLTAGFLAGDRWAVLDGNKLEYQQEGHARVAFEHPLLAEAERLLPLEQGNVFLVAGVQGAYLVEPGHGRVTDLFGEAAGPAGLGKLKRIFELDDGVLLATATYGTFRSDDEGQTWQAADAEWAVLDAEHLMRSDDGRWWLGCQRALFVSDDNGRRWRYVKFKLAELPHYCELRGGLAVVGGQLFIATKTGLLVAPLASPERIARVAAFGEQAIEALFTDDERQLLLVGTHGAGQDRLWRYDPVEEQAQPLTAPGQVPVFESQIGGTLSACLIASGERLFRLACAGEGPVVLEEMMPQPQAGDYHIASDSQQRLLVWNERSAWRWHGGEEPLQALPDWPAGVRHACIRADGRSALTTDRRQLRTVSLPCLETAGHTAEKELMP